MCVFTSSWSSWLFHRSQMCISRSSHIDSATLTITIIIGQAGIRWITFVCRIFPVFLVKRQQPGITSFGPLYVLEEPTRQWITTIDTLEASFPNKALVALGDLNCRARTLGHSRLNDSGPILDTWIQVSDNFDVHLFTEPTHPDSHEFWDVVIYKDLDAPPEISFEDRVFSNHRGILTRIELKDGHNLSRESPVVRLQMKPINKALTQLVRKKGGFTFQEFAHIVRTEVQRRQKRRRPLSKNHQYRRRCYWFKPSKSLERLKESMFQAQKAGQQDRFKELRNQYQKMLNETKLQRLLGRDIREQRHEKILRHAEATQPKVRVERQRHLQ